MIQERDTRSHTRGSRGMVLWILLCLDGLLIVTPKLVLIQYTNVTLWGDIAWGNFVGAIVQDVLVAIVMIAIALLIISKADWKRVAIGAALTGILLLLLMVDMRARELWLKPIDVALVLYYFENVTHLSSGADIFFKHYAGLGMTFRRLLFLVVFTHLAIWALISWTILRKHARALDNITVRHSILALALAAAACLVIVAYPTSGYRYRMNENIAVGPFTALRPTRSADALASLAGSFELKAQSLSVERDRSILRNIKPFKNVVVIVYESVRWHDLDRDDTRNTLSPTLARMASEGILSKSRVSVPHSSKAYFTILSGRYPYPGVEMREVMSSHHDSIWHDFSRYHNGATFAFSSLYLAFENMGGLLQTLGIDQRFETADLAKAAGVEAETSTSFGTSDELLYTLGAQFLSKRTTPFAAIFFPMAAHYPYDCPGAKAGRHSHVDYLACLKYSDTLLGKMIDEFRRLNLMQDTLFVVVGDHGESFGEHGLFVHNSSMYEEEVTVPLVFWSDDGRLAHYAVPTSQQIDIAPTIADLMGMMDSKVPVQGVSLLRRNERAAPMFMSTFFEGVGQSMVEDSVKYIWEISADQLLAFDLNLDPDEKSPKLISGQEKEAIVKRLKAFQAYQELAFPRER